MISLPHTFGASAKRRKVMMNTVQPITFPIHWKRRGDSVAFLGEDPFTLDLVANDNQRCVGVFYNDQLLQQDYLNDIETEYRCLTCQGHILYIVDQNMQVCTYMSEDCRARLSIVGDIEISTTLDDTSKRLTQLCSQIFETIKGQCPRILRMDFIKVPNNIWLNEIECQWGDWDPPNLRNLSWSVLELYHDWNQKGFSPTSQESMFVGGKIEYHKCLESFVHGSTCIIELKEFKHQNSKVFKIPFSGSSLCVIKPENSRRNVDLAVLRSNLEDTPLSMKMEPSMPKITFSDVKETAISSSCDCTIGMCGANVPLPVLVKWYISTVIPQIHERLYQRIIRPTTP